MSGDAEKLITAKMVLDSSGFNESLHGVNSQLKLAQSEFKSASASVGAFGKDSASLKSVQEALSKQVELQSQKVAIYGQNIDKTNAKMQTGVQANEKLKVSITNANKAYDEAVKLYGKQSTEAQKAKQALSNLEEEYTKNQRAVEYNAKSVEKYTTDVNKAKADLATMQGQLSKTSAELEKSNNNWLKSGESLIKSSEKLKTIGASANAAGNSILMMTAPLVGVGLAAAKVGMDFDSEMSRVKAISGATGDEFKKLNDLALQLGADTAFSSSQVAQGMENMASAGFDTNQVMAAMPGMLALAASGGIDVATASDVAASALNGFGLEAGQAGHVADVLASAAAQTNAGVSDMGQALKYAAPPAKALGLSMEEVSAAIGLMSNAGIKGESAGTALRGALTKLASPSKEAATMMKDLGINAFDSNGKMLPLSQVLGILQGKMKGLTDEQKANAIATIFGQESMSGMLALIQAGPEKLDQLTKGFKNSDGAAADMAATMQDNAKASIEQMFGSLETAGIKLEQSFAPTIKKVADSVGILADKFAALSPETQDAIVKAVGLAVAGGATLKVVGGLASGVGGILGVMGKFAGAMGAAEVAAASVGTATTVATGAAGAGGVVGLGASLGGLAIAAAPFLLAGAAVAGVGYLVYKGMTQEAIPSVNLFADAVQTTSGDVVNASTAMAQGTEGSYIKISEATQKAVGAYMKLDDDATAALTSLYANSTVITDELVTSTTSKYFAMGEQIKAGDDKNNADRLASMQKLFTDSNTMTDTEEQTILTKMQGANVNKKAEIDKYSNEILAIYQGARDRHEALSFEEEQKIAAIQSQMKTNAVATLSQSEQEQAVIMGRIKDYGVRMTTEQASETIKKAEEQRVGVVDKANLQYAETVKAIKYQRDELKTITSAQADAMIADAEKQKNGTIAKADEQKTQVVNKIKEMNSGVESSVNTSTGKILTIWDRLASWWANWTPSPKVFTGILSDKTGVGQNWTGNTNFAGGYTTLHEKGYELYDLPKSTRIFNHEASEDLVLKTAEKVATKVAQSMLGSANGGGLIVQIENFNNARSQDVQAFGEELEFYRRQKSLGMGGV